MTRLSHLLFVIHITTVIFPFICKTFLDTLFYLYGIQDYSTLITLPGYFLLKHTRLLFLDNINPLHAVYSLYTSLPLAHKLLHLAILFLYVLYSLYMGLSLTHKFLGT